MSDDKPAKTQDNPSTTTSPPRQNEDLLSTVRRFADERISAALHSVFGIPSILQPPQSSNWIVEDGERNRFEGTSRREGAADEPRNDSSRNDDRNNSNNNENGSNNNSGGGSGVSGFGGGSDSSGQQGPSSSPSGTSSNRNINEDPNGFRLPKSLMPPAVLLPELLFSLGVHSADIVERSLVGHIREMEKLIEEESERQKAISASKLRIDLGPFHREFQKLLESDARSLNQKGIFGNNDQESTEQAPTSETIVIQGKQINDDNPKFTITRHSGHTVHPSATLPESVDSLGHLFKLMMAPWIKSINESMDPAVNVRGRVLDRINDEMWNDIRQDSPSQAEFNRMMHEERMKMTREWMQRLAERRQELEKTLEERRQTMQKKIEERQVEKSEVDKAVETAVAELMSIEHERHNPAEKKQPETEFHLHDYFASLGKDKDERTKEMLVSQSLTSVSTTDIDGITRRKRVRERRYSDGTIEREEHQEENTSPAAHFGELEERKRQYEQRNNALRRLIESDKQDRARTSDSAAKPPNESGPDDDRKNGGWSSWIWASGEKD
ncbi:hypothetical protein ABW20_dc0105678 [Dactylellina cionopaga]|nr:hypothetical protein ABW20_dc0105678 [Dactylellina cionopaga]